MSHHKDFLMEGVNVFSSDENVYMEDEGMRFTLPEKRLWAEVLKQFVVDFKDACQRANSKINAERVEAKLQIQRLLRESRDYPVAGICSAVDLHPRIIQKRLSEILIETGAAA